MPPAWALGFHFSKWDKVSAQTIIDRNDDFSENKFQVDVLWLDIEHAQDY